jgi:uncharacterized protein (DUF488 family)
MRLANAGVKRVIDVRLNNVSQLAGFAKKGDLRYFLKTICQIEYEHKPELAPTQEILDAYRKRRGSWDTYAEQFLKLMAERKVEEMISHEHVNQACLLCSEAQAHRCHRRLVAEYLKEKWGELEIIHL